MKKMICLLLAMLCLLSLCACGGAASSNDTAPAAEPEPAAEEESPEEVIPTPEPLPPYESFDTNFGFRFEYPEEYQNLKGDLAWIAFSTYNAVATLKLYYVELPEEERAAFREENALNGFGRGGPYPEWVYKGKSAPLFNIEALYDNDDYVSHLETVTPAAYLDSFYPEKPANAKRALAPVHMETIALENNWKLVVQRPQYFTFEGEEFPLADNLDRLDEEYRDEAMMLLENPDLLISGLKEIPWELPGQVGSQVSFESRTLQGDTITSEDLFSGHKVTMVNVWATWCGPCIGEMPALEQLSAGFAEKDCQIIGICLDARDDETKEKALQILEENGVTYPNIAYVPGMDWANTQTIPTSFFISEDGTILTETVVGASISSYPGMLNKALALVG